MSLGYDGVVNSTKVAEFLLDMNMCGNSFPKHEALWKESGNRTLTNEERNVVSRFLRSGVDSFNLCTHLLGQWLETDAVTKKMIHQEDS